MTTRPHLLVVDDEAGIRESLSSILADEGYDVDSVASAEEALERAAAGDIEVVLLDVWLPGIDGLEALSRLQATARPPAVIMISGHGTIETAVRATSLGFRFHREAAFRWTKSSCWCATLSNNDACRKKINCCVASLVIAIKSSVRACR